MNIRRRRTSTLIYSFFFIVVVMPCHNYYTSAVIRILYEIETINRHLLRALMLHPQSRTISDYCNWALIFRNSYISKLAMIVRGGVATCWAWYWGWCAFSVDCLFSIASILISKVCLERQDDIAHLQERNGFMCRRSGSVCQWKIEDSSCHVGVTAPVWTWKNKLGENRVFRVFFFCVGCVSHCEGGRKKKISDV